ncbi:MAG: PcfJ domain-containing protein [Kiritimatiellia bacterium]
MTTHFQKPRPGIAFKNGKLYEFRARRIVVLRAWPEPMAWCRTSKAGWRATRKWADELLVSCFSAMAHPAQDPGPLDRFRLVPMAVDQLKAEGCSPEQIEERRVKRWKAMHYAWREREACIQPFMEQIPQAIRELIAPLRHRAWHLLCMLARCPGAMDLCRNNPALAFALSGHWIYREHPVRNPMRAARGLVNRRQRDILAWMGFPGTKSTQQIFRKIAVSRLDPLSLRKLKEALNDPARHKALRHVSVITAPVLSVILREDLFRLSTMSLLEEMAVDDAQGDRILSIMRDTCRLNEQQGGGHLPAPFRTARALIDRHDELAGMHRRQNIRLARNTVFPDPPYAGHAQCQPVRTMKELLEEGLEMRHCVASYAEDVAGGSFYIYRILQPVRATLAISWQVNCWRVYELQGPGNTLVPSPVYESIVTSFFEGTCLRGPLQPPAGEDGSQAVAHDPEYPLEPNNEDPPPPWVPCDQDGHPVMLFSDDSNNTVKRLCAIFSE